MVLASSSAGKLRELAGLLAPLNWNVRPQSEFGCSDADETGLSFIENALIKARHAAAHTGLPALADDSGLCVDALHGAPGIYSARYAGVHGDDAGNIAKLLAQLQDVPDAARGAQFVCCIVLVRSATDPLPLIAQGFWRGRVLQAPRGSGGFGYDPIFWDPVRHCSASEMEIDIRNQISHRAIALRALCAQLG